MSLVNGMVASTLFAMPKPVEREVSLHMVALENSLTMKGPNFGTSLFALWFGFPFADGGVTIARAVHGGLEESKAMTRISRNADLHKLLFDLVIAFKFGGRVLGWITSIVHGVDEFLDVDVIQSSTVGGEVVENFDGCMVSETQAFAAKACKPFGINGLNDFCLGGLEASLVCFVLNDALFVFCKLA